MPQVTMPLPALKESIPYFVRDDAVHFRLAGEITTFDDPDGRVRALLALFDGTRTAEDAHRELQAAYPDLTLTEVEEAVAGLAEHGFVQDARDTGEDFSPDEVERWSRNLGFWEVYASLEVSKYEFQRRIRDARVAMLGLGGVGSHILFDMVAMGFTDIRVVDFDVVELSNLNRQILYGEPDLGHGKVAAATRRAKALNSSVRIDAVEKRMLSADDVYEVVHDRDVVISAVDRPKMQIVHWVNEACVRAGAAFLGGGVEGLRALHYTVVPGLSGCAECWYTAIREQDPTSAMVFDELDRIAASGSEFGEDRPAFLGQVLPHVSFTIGDLVRLVTGIAPPLSVGRALEVRFTDPQVREVESWKRRPDCAVCAGVQPRADGRLFYDPDMPLPF